MMPRALLCLLGALFLSIPLETHAGTVSLPQSGQATSYAAGDDGALRTGTSWPAPRFVDNGDQTVTDTLTGLMWEKSAYGGSGSVNPYGGISGSFTWQHALDTAAYYNSINHLGYRDWRLPNVNELKSLLDPGRSPQADWLMSQGFSNVLTRTYWTSTTEMSTRIGAYTVDMATGMITLGTKSLSQSYAWYVRTGPTGAVSVPRTGQKNCWGTDGSYQSCSGTGEDGALQSGTVWPAPRFTDNSKTNPSDLTMTDTLTGLIWTKSGAVAGVKTWQQALDFVQGLNGSNYLGRSDWRLPNRIELESLAQLNYVNTAFQLTQQGFSTVYAAQYWSSTTSANDNTKAWAVDLNRSCTFEFAKSSTYYVWPVRGGQGTAPVLSASPGGKDFGTVTTNAAATQSFTITNSGTAALTVSGLFITGGDSSMFILGTGDGSAGTCGPAATLTPGSSCSVSATFAPGSSGAKSTSLRIASNDPATPTKDVPLSGTAVYPSYVISTSVIGGGGSISCDSPILSGNASVCSIAPGTGYRLAAFTDNGTDRFASVSGNKYSIYNVTVDHAIQGSFGPNTPVITWCTPADIVYGTPLSATQLNATSDIAGTFLYTPGAGTVLHAGVQNLSVTFTPIDPTYVTASKTVPLTVAKAVPVITWGAPAGIVYGTPLSAAQLNATVDVPGTFAYSPGAGTILNAGIQPLTVTFTPNDEVDYTSRSATVPLAVAKADQTITFPPIGKMSFKDAGFDPGATASSGLPVTYASSDTSVAVSSGGLIEIIGGGNAQITAYQLGNDNYNPALPQIQPLKVTGRRSQDPGLTIETLPDGSATTDPVLTIVGSVSRLFIDGNVVVQVINNGVRTSYVPTVAFPSGNFTLSLPLGAGDNVVEIIATSKFGVSADRRILTFQPL